jgi:hypothetical protein
MNILPADDYAYLADLVDQVPACVLEQLRHAAYLSGHAHEPILEVERIAELVEATAARSSLLDVSLAPDALPRRGLFTGPRVLRNSVDEPSVFLSYTPSVADLQ